jgi:hypothetical protein
MAADTNVDVNDAVAGGHHPIGYATSPVGAVSRYQDSTQQTGRMFIQRSIFHLSSPSAVRNVFAHNFAEQLAAPFGANFPLTEARPNGVADVGCSVGTVDHVLKKPGPAPWPQGLRKVGLPLFKGEACVS